MSAWIDDDAWMTRAECATEPTETFYPENNQYTAARRICNACPVRTDCLTYSMLLHEHHGMWGGMSPDERVRFAEAIVVDHRHPSATQ